MLPSVWFIVTLSEPTVEIGLVHVVVTSSDWGEYLVTSAIIPCYYKVNCMVL